MSLYRQFIEWVFPNPEKPNYECESCGEETDPYERHYIGSDFVCIDCFNDQVFR